MGQLTALLPILVIFLTSAASDTGGHSRLDDLPEELRDAEVTFAELCASCHGAAGEGKGTAVLDRPARSFKDGGFSFGNTKEALFRTLKSGIPGTPMPAFGGQVSDDRLRELACLVQFFGPGGEPEPPRGTELVVGERPLIVRGILPPLEGDIIWTAQGLLIGDPSGMSFEYSLDDVSLLSVRFGGFVNRNDGEGRRESSLQPLGKEIYLPRGHNRGWGPDWFPREWSPAWKIYGNPTCRTRLLKTSIAGGKAKIKYYIRDGGVLKTNSSPKASFVATCIESPRMISTSRGSGYVVSYEVSTLDNGLAILTFSPFPNPSSQSWTLLGYGDRATGELATGHVRCHRPLKDPGNELRMFSLPSRGISYANDVFSVLMYARESIKFEIGVVFLTEWSDENAKQVLREVRGNDD
jgi:hypothetical protein